MPSFISNNGIWGPAKERVATVDENGNPQIYNGPDRSAMKFIKDEGGIVGKDSLTDPELLMASRNMGFKTVEDYLAYFKPTPKQEAEKIEADAKPVTHTYPAGKEGVEPSQGGFFDPELNETPDSVMTEKKQRGRPRKG